MKTIQSVLSSAKKITTLPNIITKVDELIHDSTCSASDLGDVISKDTALTARLLHLVNSAFFSYPSHIDTISRAVAVIGIRQLRELLFATTIMGMFCEFCKACPINLKSFWEHCVATAVACRILAIYRREENPEKFFLAGLLHDIGRLVLIENSPDECKKIYREKETYHYAHDLEREAFGFTHADVGIELIKIWQLPSYLGEAISFHVNPSISTKFRELTALVYVSNIIVKACQIGFSGDPLIPSMNQAIWDQTGLRKSILDPAIDRIYEQFEDALAFLGMNATEA